jgi:hypothetical protein
MRTSIRRSCASQRGLSTMAAIGALLACISLSACTAEAPSPASTTAALPATPLPESGELDGGTYIVTGFTVPFEITVPEGWESNGWFLSREGSGGTGVAVNFGVPGYVPTDACAWASGITEVDPSTAAFADAMAAQTSTVTTPTKDIEISGFPGLEFDQLVEADVDITDCDGSKICLHSEVGDDCTRWHSSVNERETYRLIDLNGDRVVMAVLETGSVDPSLATEARAVFDSIVFAPAQ